MSNTPFIHYRNNTKRAVRPHPRFSPLRRVTFSCLPKRKSPKRRAPRHPGLAAAPPDFPPSGAASGAVTKGRPCPFVPRSASCLASPCATPPLGLLTGTRAPRCRVVFLCAARMGRFHAPRGSHREINETFRQRQTPLQEGELIVPTLRVGTQPSTLCVHLTPCAHSAP